MASKKFRINSAASLNLTQVQQLGGNLKGVIAVNTNVAARFLKFYDSTDIPVVGTTVPALTVQLAPSAMTSPQFPADGLGFKSSLWVAMTGGVADTDVAAIGAGDVLVTIGYD